MVTYFAVVRVEYPPERRYSQKTTSGPFQTRMLAHLDMQKRIEADTWFLDNDGALMVIGEVIEERS